MPSPDAERAATEAFAVGKALVKTISANDTGATGGHQAGFYLPKAAHRIFTPYEPVRGRNDDHPVSAVWPDGTVTNSTVKWYGDKSRSEYRLTGFNRIRHFPYSIPDNIGSLMVLVPMEIDYFHMYVFDTEEDIEYVLSALGADLTKGWDLFDASLSSAPESERTCLDRKYREIAAALIEFPTTQQMSDQAFLALVDCIAGFQQESADDRLLKSVNVEYELFTVVERKLCELDVTRLFRSIDDFLSTAQTILQRRKARAGKSFEHHVYRVLTEAEIPFDRNPRVDGTEPDILIPGKGAYEDAGFPASNLFAVGVKTTCKDRWRQVLQEAQRADNRFIFTLQRGVSTNQLNQMDREGVSLVVPKGLVSHFPVDGRDKLFTVDRFIQEVSSRLAV